MSIVEHADRLGIKVDVASLPPYIPIWQDKNSSRRKTPSVCDILVIGKTAAFALVKAGKIKVVRFGERKTLVELSSVIEYIESIVGQGNVEKYWAHLEWMRSAASGSGA